MFASVMEEHLAVVQGHPRNHYKEMNNLQKLIVILLFWAIILALISVIVREYRPAEQFAEGDLNRDGKVDIQDWSVALYWGSKTPD